MRAHQAVFRIASMARVLQVSRSGYYAWRRRAASARAVSDAALSEEIRAAHEESRETYGAPRIQAELRSRGHRVSRKRVARLMRRQGLEGVSRRRRFRTTVRNGEARPAPDLVERDFHAQRPDQLWVADITYIATRGRTVYLAVVLDACSRRVVGWALSLRLFSSLVLDALEMAVEQRQPAGVIHHSDQGSQYTSLAFGLRCRRAGVRPSMGSVGDCYDNAMAESFFATVECELLDRTVFATPEDARRAIFDFIEGFYNTRRRHSALGYQAPVAFEAQFRGQP